MGEAQERSVRVSDRSVWAYDVPGPAPDAPAVVLLHGLGVTSHLNWRPSYAALAREFRVVAVDLRGHGRGGRGERFTLEACADDAVGVLQALGLGPAVMAGYSLGGPVAKLAWRRHRDSVAGLVLAATTSEFGNGRRQRLLRPLLPVAELLVRTRPEHLRQRLVERAQARLDGFEVPERIAAELAGHDLPTVVQAVRAASGFRSTPWLREIDVPVGVVVTSDDDRIDARRQRALAAGIPGAVTYEVPGPHTACVTRADAFVPRLVEACRDVWQRA